MFYGFSVRFNLNGSDVLKYSYARFEQFISILVAREDDQLKTKHIWL
jgi:hypothetical protein